MFYFTGSLFISHFYAIIVDGHYAMVDV